MWWESEPGKGNGAFAEREEKLGGTDLHLSQRWGQGPTLGADILVSMSLSRYYISFARLEASWCFSLCSASLIYLAESRAGYETAVWGLLLT